MVWIRSNISKRSVAVGDGYRSLSDLLLKSLKVRGFRLPNGTIQIKTNGATFDYGSQPEDLAAGVGQDLGAGTSIGMNSDLEAAWDLAEIWVRNTTPGSIATIICNGPIFKEKGITEG